MKVLRFYHRFRLYLVNEKGEINSNGLGYYSNTWIFLGGSKHHWSNRINVTLADAFKEPTLLNGCLGWDKDHGTVRTWGGQFGGKLPRITGARVVELKGFKIGSKVKTNVVMTDDDIGEAIPLGSVGVVRSEPTDEEELVFVHINETNHYLPQDVLDILN